MDIYKAKLINGNETYLGIPIDVTNIITKNRRSDIIRYLNEKLGQNLVCSIKYIYSINDAG